MPYEQPASTDVAYAAESSQTIQNEDPDRQLDPQLSMWGDKHISIDVAWRNLIVRSKREPDKVLLNCSGLVKQGFTCLMGPSGAGKSTLMDALAYRLNNVTVEGERFLNGKPYNGDTLRQCSGYVTQMDILGEYLTVEETMVYAAKLKLPKTWTSNQINERVDSVLNDMGLYDNRKTVVGGVKLKGISGGQRKRLSTGLELLSNPRVLFCDEITTGLDSSTAASLCSLLANMVTTRNVNIICTIHQPSAKIFSMFSSLILLRAGQIVYHGQPLEAVAFFEKRGFPCPALTNPADHIMDVVDEVPMARLLTDNKDATGEPQLEIVQGLDIKPRPKLKDGSINTIYYSVVTPKEALNGWKNIVTQWVIAAFVSTLVGCYLINTGEADAKNALITHVKILVFCAITSGVFGALNMINIFPRERILMLKERNSGLYCTSAYFLARITVEKTKALLNPILYSSIFYYMIPLNPSVDRFFIFMAFMVLTQWCAMSLALAVSAGCRNPKLIALVLPMVLDFCRLASGFFTLPEYQKPYLMWMDYISYLFYGYSAILQNDLRGLMLGVPPQDGYNYVVDNGYDFLTIPQLAGVMISYSTMCLILAYLFMRFLKN